MFPITSPLFFSIRNRSFPTCERSCGGRSLLLQFQSAYNKGEAKLPVARVRPRLCPLISPPISSDPADLATRSALLAAVETSARRKRRSVRTVNVNKQRG